MYEVIATESHIWIVTELCCGGELFDYLVEKGRLSEDETRVIFGQLCLAVAYLHDNNIVHRDLTSRTSCLMSAAVSSLATLVLQGSSTAEV
jgi:serine/threonine protein kinase